MSDQFSAFADNVSAPATRAVAVTPHDTNPLADLPKALFIGTGGDLACRGVGGGSDVTFKVNNGQLLPFRAQYIRATGTSAANILALY